MQPPRSGTCSSLLHWLVIFHVVTHAWLLISHSFTRQSRLQLSSLLLLLLLLL
jgi:hypothetical protein